MFYVYNMNVECQAIEGIMYKIIIQLYITHFFVHEIIQI